MKKVTGYIGVRPLGCYDFEFYVDDNTTNEEIERRIQDLSELSMHYDVEDGYVIEQTIVYRKKS